MQLEGTVPEALVRQRPASSSEQRLDDALERVQHALDGDVRPLGLARPHAIAVALRELESALHERAADCWLEEPAPGDRSALQALRSELCRLGCRAEALSAAIVVGNEEPDDEVRRLLQAVRRAMSREADAFLDAWWVDIGVGD